MMVESFRHDIAWHSANTVSLPSQHHIIVMNRWPSDTLQQESYSMGRLPVSVQPLTTLSVIVIRWADITVTLKLGCAPLCTV